MTVDKTVFANQVKEGQKVEDIFLVRDMNRAETRSAKPYLIMTLMDRSGEIGARLWDNADTYLKICEPGNLVKVSGQVQAYRGVLQLKVDTVLPVDKNEADIGLYLQSSRRSAAKMAEEITALAHGIKNPFCRQLLLEFFRDQVFFDKFQQAPAAKSMHHAYIGGLLEHTLAVSQLAAQVSELYPVLDRDLLITGAMLHDIGKTREFAFDAFPFEYTDMGRLMGHLVIGVEMVQDKIDSLAGFPEELAVKLKHLILSHHGRHEFGSPALPMTSEAFVLNFLDDLDAKLNFLGRLEEQATAPGYQWTDYQRTLERFLYIKGQPPAEQDKPASQDNAENDAHPNSHQQQNLF